MFPHLPDADNLLSDDDEAVEESVKLPDHGDVGVEDIQDPLFILSIALLVEMEHAVGEVCDKEEHSTSKRYSNLF